MDTCIARARINEPIYDQGQISGNFTVPKNRGSGQRLDRRQLCPQRAKGAQQQPADRCHAGCRHDSKGVYSMLVATVAVVIFMVIYYRFAGVVANIALLLNVLLIVAFMIMFNAAFTLSGLAGLALTVGMAVDANVLIYERMREEFARGDAAHGHPQRFRPRHDHDHRRQRHHPDLGRRALHHGQPTR